ncbi:MAG: hypothetical protein EPN85_07175 [Bacteroidetes bacterium]|nr:MAG: hypothetical protein EPN85_07175 [Bacteroidota bacterium]
MKKTLFVPLLCLSLLSFTATDTKKKAKKISVSGTVTQTRDYCGGARPNSEILMQLGTPKPAANKKIYIKEGDVNTFESKVLLALTTDAKGDFHAKLRSGRYLIVDSTKKDLAHYTLLLNAYKNQTKSYDAIDTACLKEWYMKPAGAFEITGKETKNVSVNFHITCRDVPCAWFRGPYPQ